MGFFELFIDRRSVYCYNVHYSNMILSLKPKKDRKDHEAES